MATPTAIEERGTRRAASWLWLRDLIQREVAPYPGRVNTVVRMTVTATLVMIIVVAFRIPNPFLSAFFSLILARDNLVTTWRGARLVVLGFSVASAYILVGMMLFRGFPICHFFWVVGSLYLIFFVMRTTTNYGVAWAFSIPIGISLPVWDRPMPSQAQVAGTLWPIVVIAVGAGVSVATEAIYRIFDRSDSFITSVDDMLLAVQELAESIAAADGRSNTIVARVLQYQAVGSGRLRTALVRAGLDPTKRAQRSALLSLADRLISLAAEIESNPPAPNSDDAIRLGALSRRIAAMRTQLRGSMTVSAVSSVREKGKPSGLPMLEEMERTVQLMTEVSQRDEVTNSRGIQPPGGWRSLFVPDAFQNPEYVRFALAGCFAASVCYFLYNALAWPGISISVLTCIVTALTTIGSSVQAQLFRLAGFVVGGVLMGMGAQILILPGLDTVLGFALFFAAGTAFAAWFATSSPRLSFLGLQIALAFYFVNLQDFHVQTDLTIARDKLCGVLLGILAMGFIFDRYGTHSDAMQMHQLLVRNVRMLAQLMAPPVAGEQRGANSHRVRLATQIDDNFASLASQMDTLQFELEFHQRRRTDVVEKNRIKKVQPPLRCIYVLELSLMSHRDRRDATPQLTARQNDALDQFLNDCSQALLFIAARIEQGGTAAPAGACDCVRRLGSAFEGKSSPRTEAIADICAKMASSLRMLDS